MQSDSSAVTRLKAILEADPGSLVRVLQFFQALNVTPQRVTSHRHGAELLEMEIEIDAGELPVETVRRIAAKINELTFVVCAVVSD